MAYFRAFPYLAYPSFADPKKEIFVKNITARVVKKLNPSNKDDKKLYYSYVVKEGESPDTISNSYYNTPDYYWTILIVNNIFDLNYDWPMSYAELIDYIEDTYGSVAIAQADTRYFVKPQEDSTAFLEVPEDVFTNYAEYTNGVLTRYSTSSYDLEIEANEEKRNIILIKKEFVSTFINLFEEALQ